VWTVYIPAKQVRGEQNHEPWEGSKEEEKHTRINSPINLLLYLGQPKLLLLLGPLLRERLAVRKLILVLSGVPDKTLLQPVEGHNVAFFPLQRCLDCCVLSRTKKKHTELNRLR